MHNEDGTPNDDQPSPAPSDDQSPQNCVVVGIGASAGGLEAYKLFLRHIPDDTGMAFVLVQHLDPHHDSLMAELLTKYTSMPVSQVEGVTLVEPNHVYVIPPSRSIRIKDDTLFLDDPHMHRGVRLPIDYFFRSLAEARRERCVCIVLSGTGSDGAEGLREVKAEGGLTIVQEPDTAQHAGMPQAAIATGSVDFVLPIPEMPEVILRYAQNSYIHTNLDTTFADTSPDLFRAILSVLRAHTDQDFSHYKKGTLTRRIERRMNIRRTSTLEDYLTLLRDDVTEVHALFKDMLIGVTRFFRDGTSWESLGEVMSRKLLERHDEEPIRVWVPGCATGEEAYTVAMLLVELFERQNKRLNIQVFATDIDSDAINVARSGIYPENITKDISESQIDTFFSREGDKLRVKKRLRDMCVFAVQNLLTDPPFSHLDLICCRNLLIYMEADIQQRVFEMFYFGLKPNGLLFLGSSESPTRRKQLFEVISQASRLYRKIGDSRPGTGGFPVDSTKPRIQHHSRQLSEIRDGASIGTVELSKKVLLDAFAPASVVINQRGLIQYIHGPVRNYLDFPSGEPQLDLFDMVFEGLKSKVRTALQQASSTNEPSSVLAPGVQRNGDTATVRIRIQPIPGSRESDPLYLCSFLDEPPVAKLAGVTDDDLKMIAAEKATTDLHLAQELQAAREDLQSTIEELESANEELKASNEEIMSMNEELQSTNEELETSREELQSLNEELSTVNAQLHEKVAELEATTNDLANLLTSTDMATLFLDSDLRIRRYTPATVRLMNLLPTDIGRPISDMASRIKDPDMVMDAHEVLDRLTPIEKEVRSGGEHWYVRRITPFRTSENKIEGVVLTFSDVTKLKEASSRVEFRERQQAVIAQLGRVALAGSDLVSLCDRAARDIADTLQVEFSKVLQLRPESKDLLLLSGVGWREGLVGRESVGYGLDSQAGYTLQTAGPVIVKDLRKEKRFRGPSLLTGHDIVSGISVVIGPEKAPWGVLGVHSQQEVEFTIDDANFVTAVANVLWEAIRRDAIEAELRDNEARTAAFLNNSAVIGWMKDDQGRHVYLSRNYERCFGVKIEDWLGKTDEEVWPAEIAKQFRINDQRVLETGETIEVIEEAIYPNGERAQFLTSKFRFFDAAGKLYVGGLGVDITDRMEAERARTESEERLRLAARMAGFGIYYGNVETDEMTWSPELKKILGLAPEDPVQVRVSQVPDLIHEADREQLREAIQASLDPSGNGNLRHEYRVIRPDGELRWLLMQGRTVFQGKSKRRPIRVAGVILDITQRHQFEEELQRAREAAEAANEAKSQFLANMSHEIRTPMTAILGYADVLESRLRDPEAQTCIKTIKQNGDYLCEILNDILDLSKIEAGKLIAHPEECSPIELLAEVHSLMNVRALEKSLDLTIDFEGEIPQSIATDPKMIRQLLMNLVGNAIKFTQSGEVRIVASCLPEQERFQIQVTDTGVGIPKEHLERLFLPFEQIDNSSTRMAGGTGLGLAICRKLVAMLDGEITAESVVNEGSTFRFTISTGSLEGKEWVTPDAEMLLAQDKNVPIRELPRLSGHVLIVDDRKEIQLLIRQLVESAGCTTTLANDGSEGVQAWLAERDAGRSFDAILMDMQMPVMDGLEATRELRAKGYGGPILALTANTMRGDPEKCRNAGCDDFVSKPIDRIELIEKLAGWIGPGDTESTPGLSILCVDDSTHATAALKLLLEDRGHQIRAATSGAEALSFVEDFLPDAVVLDLGLPDMTGDELLKQLREKFTFQKCVSICLSGRSEDEVPWQKMGFDHYMQKPADVKELERMIRQRKRA